MLSYTQTIALIRTVLSFGPSLPELFLCRTGLARIEELLDAFPVLLQSRNGRRRDFIWGPNIEMLESHFPGIFIFQRTRTKLYIRNTVLEVLFIPCLISRSFPILNGKRNRTRGFQQTSKTRFLTFSLLDMEGTLESL